MAQPPEALPVKTLGTKFESGKKSFGPSLYASWVKQVGPHVSPPRQIDFSTAGRAPINTPSHPARLESVRQMAESLSQKPMPETVPSKTPSIATGLAGPSSPQGSQQLVPGETEANLQRSLPRSFSGECCKIVMDQVAVTICDSHRVFQDCQPFSSCSPGFLEELVDAGGYNVSHGLSFDCGNVLYTENEAGSSMFIIVKGSVSLTGKNVEGYPSPKIIGRGECFGAAEGLGVLARRQETALAKTSVHVLQVTLATLTKLLSMPKRSEAEIFSPTSDRVGSQMSERSKSRQESFWDLEKVPVQYAEERTIFEREARRLYCQIKAKKMKQGSKFRRTASTDDAPEEGHEPEAPTSPTSPTEASASPRSNSANQELSSRKKPGALTHLGEDVDVLPSPQESNSRIQQETPSSGTVLLSPPSGARRHVTCMQHPRKWREQLQQSKDGLLFGNFPDGGVARERVLQRVNHSIRADFWKGFMLPADAASRHQRGAEAQEELAQSPEGEEFQGSNRDGEDDEDVNHGNEMLETSLLPALSDMSVKQKLGLIKHMQEQAKTVAAMKKQAARHLAENVTVAAQRSLKPASARGSVIDKKDALRQKKSPSRMFDGPNSPNSPNSFARQGSNESSSKVTEIPGLGFH
eukprot:TRINITY_DN26238_c0_g1_i1.p1 TRINITY_DN26238_c0_g1~~TRINITY_DN26238_c0_g1_i1.p1  ORF type:complete len:665 (+),score=118.58 TRINITY_DN26238_c0_g1_i1:87-1997(+)